MAGVRVVGRGGEPGLLRWSWAALDLLLEEETRLVGGDEVTPRCWG